MTFEQIEARIRELMEIADADLTDDEAAELDALFAELGQAEAEKADGIGQFLKLEAARVDALKAEAKRLADKARNAESRMLRFKEYVLLNMGKAGVKKIAGAAYTLRVRESVRVAVTANVESLPAEYVRVKEIREPDKALIKDHLKQGVLIDGCTLEKSQSLQVA